MNKQIELILAARDDWQTVLEITRAAYNEYAEKSDRAFWSAYQKSIEQTLLNDKSIDRVVARRESSILGTVLYCPPYEKQLGDSLVKNPLPEMRLLAVPPQSRNQGIAALLIRYCEERAAREGYPAISLHTTVLMQTAKLMYERRGYERFEEIDFEPVPGFIVWGYRKELAPVLV